MRQTSAAEQYGAVHDNYSCSEAGKMKSFCCERGTASSWWLCEVKRTVLTNLFIDRVLT